MANNKNSKHQQIPIRVTGQNDLVAINTELEKGFSRVQGISLTLPEENAVKGATLGIVIAQLEVFPDNYEAKMLFVDSRIPLNQRWYFPDWKIDADGAPINIKYRDGNLNPYLQAGSPGSNVVPANPLPINYPFDAILHLLLTNKPQ